MFIICLKNYNKQGDIETSFRGLNWLIYCHYNFYNYTANCLFGATTFFPV